MTDGPQVLDDRRATLVAAGLVGAVVLVLGFGSGIGSVLSHDAASHAPSGGRDLGTVVQPDGDAVGVTPSLDSPLAGARRISTSRDLPSPAVSLLQTPTSMAMADHGPSPATPTTTSPPTTAPASCTSGGVVEAALTPFLVHLDKAHLEESPGQQAEQALDVDQYVETHTVMVEQMLQPVVSSVLAALQGLPPFWTHVDKAHLEESPGEQAGQALDVDQYVKTHTVLVEDMLAPTFAAVDGASCGG